MKIQKVIQTPNRYLLVLAIAVVLGLLISIVFLSNSKGVLHNSVPPIRIAVSKTPLSAPVFIADEMGFFDDHCSNVDLIEVVGGKRSFETMASGQADFATSSDSVIVYKSFARTDFVTLASFVQADNDVKFITREDSSLAQAGNFMNHKIAVIKNSASEYFLTTYLALEGVDINSVSLVNSAPENMAQMLADGEVDAIVPWEPYGYKAVKLLDGEANVLPTKNLYSLSFNLIGSKKDVDTYPTKSACVLGALSDAIDFISSNPSETQTVIGRRLNLESDFIYWMWPDYIFKLSLNKSLLMNLQSQAEWMIQTGITDNKEAPDFMQVLNPGPLATIKPEAASLLRNP